MAAALTEEARKKANLRLLQRSIDSNIMDIVGSATHVVLYEYITPQGWEKSQVEGSLFLVAQTGQQYSLAILNRHSTENFQVPVTNRFQLQHKEPYLIFKQSPKILGIWFHNSNERVVMASLLNQVIENLKRSAGSAASIAAPPPVPVAAAAPAPAPPPKPAAVPTTFQQQTLFPSHQQQPPVVATTSVPVASTIPTTTSTASASTTGDSRTAVSPMAQQIPLQATTPLTRQAQANVASPSQLIEPLMNSLFVAAPTEGTATATATTAATAGTSVGAATVGGGGGGSGGQPPQQSTPAPNSRSESGSTTPTRNIPGVALDKKSLQLALLSLIQDERFIDLLHAQYLKVAHARAHRNNKK